jgi:type I restriction enzyme S subunit
MKYDYKDSGIDWLGNVPEHWTITRLAALGTFSKGRGITKSELIDDPDGVHAILYGDIYTKYEFATDTLVNRVNEATASTATEIHQGQLILTGSGETAEEIGKCVLYNGTERAVAGGDTIIFTPRKDNARFLSYVLNSHVAIYQKTITAKGDIVVHTYPSKLRNVMFPLPPQEEQAAIAAYLDNACAKLDRIIGLKGKAAEGSIVNQQTEILRAYRKSLIHECVTGKKQVFGVASTANKEAVA